MKIENYIESKYKELISFCDVNAEYTNLYESIEHSRLREILYTIHYEFITLFEEMNKRLPTIEDEAYFWADPSRKLIRIIEITFNLFNDLNNNKLAFKIDDYYFELMKKCRTFLKPIRGSSLPRNMPKIDLYYKIPIFIPSNTIAVKNQISTMNYSLKTIGSGSYADVFEYKDIFYNRDFIVKRAKKDLNKKELERFEREFDELKELSSPYIVEVYAYDKLKHEYIMEHMDYTLRNYIIKNNKSMKIKTKKNIINQIF